MKNKKSTQSVEVGSVGWGWGIVIDQNVQNRLSGNLYEIIEAVGLPERQEQALKNVISNKVWEVFSDNIIIGDELHTAIRKKHNELKSRPNSGVLESSTVHSI